MTTNQNIDKRCEQAWNILEQIYDIWTNIGEDDGEEVRSPRTRKELRKSRQLISEAKSLDCTDTDVTERIEETERVLNSFEDVIPNYVGKIITAMVFSALFAVGIWLYLTRDVYKAPELKYDNDWYVTTQGGYIFWDAFLNEKEQAQETRKIYIKKGTQLTPISTIGEWVQVETADGQRGLINMLLLNGSKYATSSNTETKLFAKAGGDAVDTIQDGIKGVIVDRYINKDHVIWDRYLKIKFEDGRTLWGLENDFTLPIMHSLPEIEQLFAHVTNQEKVKSNFMGQPLSEFEQQYGSALSIINKQAYFEHLVVADKKMHYDGVFLNLDEQNNIKDIQYLNNGRQRKYEIFPLVATFRNAEIQNIERSFLYERDFEWKWWNNFKQKNWITRIIAGIVWFIRLALIIIVIFSVPRIVIAPLLQIFLFCKCLSNGTVILFSLIVMLVAYYLYFVLVILELDQWLIPLAGSLVFFIFWLRKLITDISYNRCPNCNSMYSALSEGSSFMGRKTTKTRGTYDVYKGTTETSTTITKKYERRDKLTTKHVDSYLDHRMCAMCGYKWDVDREEVDEKTKYY